MRTVLAQLQSVTYPLSFHIQISSLLSPRPPTFHPFYSPKTSRMNPSKSPNNSSGFSIAAKCPPASCCLYHTNRHVVATHARGIGAISPGNHEYPDGLST